MPSSSPFAAGRQPVSVSKVRKAPSTLCPLAPKGPRDAAWRPPYLGWGATQVPPRTLNLGAAEAATGVQVVTLHVLGCSQPEMGFGPTHSQ